MMPPPLLPGRQINLRPLVTLTFDVLTPEADHFMPLPRRLFVQISIKIGSIVPKILCSLVWKWTN